MNADPFQLVYQLKSPRSNVAVRYADMNRKLALYRLIALLTPIFENLLKPLLTEHKSYGKLKKYSRCIIVSHVFVSHCSPNDLQKHVVFVLRRI